MIADTKEQNRQIVYLVTEKLVARFYKLYDKTKQQNKVHKFVLKEFQEHIRNHVLNFPICFAEDTSKVFEDLVKRLGCDPQQVYGSCFKEVARAVWKQPQLLYHGLPVTEYQTNAHTYEKLVRRCVKDAIAMLKITSKELEVDPEEIVDRRMDPEEIADRRMDPEEIADELEEIVDRRMDPEEIADCRMDPEEIADDPEELADCRMEPEEIVDRMMDPEEIADELDEPQPEPEPEPVVVHKLSIRPQPLKDAFQTKLIDISKDADILEMFVRENSDEETAVVTYDHFNEFF